MNLHAYPFDFETIRLAVILGVIAGMIFYERFHLTTGGAIVPGYLALFTPVPLFIATTIVTSLLVYIIVNRVIAKRYIIYGRLKFEIEILVALLFTAFWMIVARYFASEVHPMLIGLQGIGFLIPAILAHDMSRQKPRKTLTAVAVNTAIVALFVYVFHSFRQILPFGTGSSALHLGEERFSYPFELLIFGVFFSVLLGMAIFRKLSLRTGGFVTGAYLALFLLDWRDLLFALSMALITYLVVTKLLMKWILIFGRRKLGVMSLTAAILTWSGELAIATATSGAYVPWRGFHVITLIVPALLANDAQRQGPYRTLWGAAIATTGVFGTMNLIHAARLYFSP